MASSFSCTCSHESPRFMPLQWAFSGPAISSKCCFKGPPEQVQNRVIGKIQAQIRRCMRQRYATRVKSTISWFILGLIFRAVAGFQGLSAVNSTGAPALRWLLKSPPQLGPLKCCCPCGQPSSIPTAGLKKEPISPLWANLKKTAPWRRSTNK